MKDIKYRNMYWSIGRHSSLITQNKDPVYSQYGHIDMAYNNGVYQKNNYNCLEIVPNRILRKIVNAPWYVRKKDQHRELQI